MEVNKLCHQTYVSPLSVENRSMGYSKLNVYNTPLCTPFSQKVFLDEAEPNLEVQKNMCRYNNACENTGAYTFLNKRGVEQSP